MIRLVTGSAVLMLVAFLGNAADPTDPNRALKETVEDEHRAGRFDGVVLVAQGEMLLGEYAFGDADRKLGQSHRIAERFPVASVTKQWVAVMIMRLVEQGRLALDDSIAKHLPQLDQPWTRVVTVRQLLRHESGLPQPDEVIPDFYQKADLPSDSIALASQLATKALGKPGKGFVYNNTDYVVLSAVIENVMGKPLSEALRILLLEPAGMNSSGLLTTREGRSGLPFDYELEAGNAKTAPYQELANYRGAGAGYSTASDIWAFDRAMMTNRLLNPETAKILLESSPQSGYSALGCWVYPLKIGTAPSIKVVERHGAIGGYNVVNLYVPEN